MEATFGLHWWRFVTGIRDPDEVAAGIVGVSGGEFGSPERRGGYNHPLRMVHDSGAALYFGSHVESQPIVVDVSGESCDRLSSFDLAAWAKNNDGAVTRVDLACDITPIEEARPKLLQLRRAFAAGKCTTRIPATSHNFNVDKRPGEGNMLTIGSRSSEAYLRCYDRRGPLRMEWEWKPTDDNLRLAIPNALTKRGPADLWRTIARKCVFPIDWCQQLYDGPTVDIHAEPRRMAEFLSALAAFQKQHGEQLATFMACGVLIDELAVPAEHPSGEQKRRRRQFAKEAAEAGYEPKPEMTRCRKPR